MKHVMVGMPCRSAAVDAYTVSMLVAACGACVGEGWSFFVDMVTDNRGVHFARNRIANHFLMNTVYSDLFWIDDDISTDPRNIVRFLNKSHDLLSGLYRQKAHEKCFVVRNPSMRYDDGLITHEGCGLGFTRMKRCVIEDAANHIQREAWYTDPREPGMQLLPFFCADFTDAEDINFFKFWTGIGRRAWADPDIRINHTGRATYATTYAEYAGLGRRHGAL